MNPRQLVEASRKLDEMLSSGLELGEALTALEADYGGEFFQRKPPSGNVEVVYSDDSTGRTETVKILTAVA